MPILVTPTTELEAVNALLRSIGESPVETLVGNTFLDAQEALQTLRQVSRMTQLKGWVWNIEKDYPLTPDVSGNVYLPQTALKFVSSDHPLYVQRGNRVYDTEARTYIIPEAFTATLTLGLPFEELPEVARIYITMAAVRRFQHDEDHDNEVFKVSQRDELMALAELHNHEAEIAGFNVNSTGLGLVLKGARR